ncbi:hypothetical protein KK062_19260 [Fulvivirgaceae bacterium PWU5]|uniref:Uncharacterized protein n=1 Tax=Dawidia cretensis TaxID=2782350 RepID=A0AAP2DZR5_9BACT|nr:hypothetical protein [Dawidia cretensis]
MFSVVGNQSFQEKKNEGKHQNPIEYHHDNGKDEADIYDYHNFKFTIILPKKTTIDNTVNILMSASGEIHPGAKTLELVFTE